MKTINIIEENTVAQKPKKERRDRMSKNYEAKELKYEYPNYDGEYRFVIYTPLTEEELLERFSDELKKYEPYFIASGEVFKEYVLITRAEDRRRKKKVKHETIFGYEDAVSECINAELQDGETVPSEIVVTLYEAKERQEKYNLMRKAFCVLTPTQERRIIARFYDGKSARTIADEEGVNYSKVYKSIEAALKKMKEFMESVE